MESADAKGLRHPLACQGAVLGQQGSLSRELMEVLKTRVRAGAAFSSCIYINAPVCSPVSPAMATEEPMQLKLTQMTPDEHLYYIGTCPLWPKG